HLLVAAALPYLCIFARSLDGGRTQPVDEIIAGILAGVGCALKPQFLVAFALLEGVGRIHGLRPVRPMPSSVVVTVFGCVGVLAVFYPAYFASAVPAWPFMARATSAGDNCSATVAPCCSAMRSRSCSGGPAAEG